jgi:hypothetical protein
MRQRSKFLRHCKTVAFARPNGFEASVCDVPASISIHCANYAATHVPLTLDILTRVLVADLIIGRPEKR